MINQRNTTSRAVALILIVGMMLTLCCSCTPKADTVDYSQPENWAYYGIGAGKEAIQHWSAQF